MADLQDNNARISANFEKEQFRRSAAVLLLRSGEIAKPGFEIQLNYPALLGVVPRQQSLCL